MSLGTSRRVESGQTDIHPHLADVVAKHFRHPFRRPLGPLAQAACREALAGWDGRAPLLLDAGCGVGISTYRLARAHPTHWVMGVDQSADRLARIKGEAAPDNAVLVRADLVDFWRALGAHLASQGVSLDRHYLLYPNPWPKIGHLQRRWHGHPVFPSLLALGGRLECRSNWSVYVEELAAALDQAAAAGWIGLDADGVTQSAVSLALPDGEALTPFERKYALSGHGLYRLTAHLLPHGKRQHG